MTVAHERLMLVTSSGLTVWRGVLRGIILVIPDVAERGILDLVFFRVPKVEYSSVTGKKDLPC